MLRMRLHHIRRLADGGSYQARKATSRPAPLQNSPWPWIRTRLLMLLLSCSQGTRSSKHAGLRCNCFGRQPAAWDVLQNHFACFLEAPEASAEAVNQSHDQPSEERPDRKRNQSFTE